MACGLPKREAKKNVSWGFEGPRQILSDMGDYKFQTEHGSPKNVKATNSCTGLIRTQAGVFGIMHPHKK